MTDHEAITRVVARYCHLLDDGRWDEFADLWADDAELVLGGETTRGRDAIRASIEATQPPERRGRRRRRLHVLGPRPRGQGEADVPRPLRRPARPHRRHVAVRAARDHLLLSRR